MSPDERDLLKRTLELAEENNDMLRSLKRAQTWSAIWGLIKLAIIVVPLIIGYVYLEPYIGSMGNLFKEAQSVMQMYNSGIVLPR
jgi:hypothetical protein